MSKISSAALEKIKNLLGPGEFSADRAAAASLKGGPGTSDPGLIT